MPPPTYVCARCGQEFESDWTDEDALAEKDALWPTVPIEDCDRVCQDCFDAIMKD